MSAVPAGVAKGTRCSTAQLAQACAIGWYFKLLPPASQAEMATMVAISLAESQGYCQAVSQVASDGTQGFGVCQIESSHTELGTFDATGSNGWPNPITNFNFARQVWAAAGGSFEPWTTYQTGAYRIHVPAAQGAVAAVAGGESLDTALAALNSIPEVTQYVSPGFIQGVQQGVQQDVQGAESAASVLGDIGAFFGKLANIKTWASVGFISIGMIVFLVGLERATGVGGRLKRAAAVAAVAA